jgi:hypothetical protein
MFRRLEKEKLRSINVIDWGNLTFQYKNEKICININDAYPFKPPVLLIQNIDHIDWFLKEYRTFTFLKKFRINTCICCDTMICSWLPTYTIDQVIDEYKIYYDKYELLKKIEFVYKQQFFDDLVHEKIFLYLDI